MKYWIIFLTAMFGAACSNATASLINADITVGGGYRKDNLSWAVDSQPHSNVITKQDWQGLGIIQEFGRLDLTLCNHGYLRIEGGYGWIQEGSKAFDEWDLDGTVSLSEDGWLKANSRGYVYDISSGLGYVFPFFCNTLKITPLIGYAYSVQHFDDDNYLDKVYLVNFFEGIYSHYTYRWRGPWIGCNLSYECFYGASISLEYQFHWDQYRGKVEDNLTANDKERQKNNCVWGNNVIARINTPYFYYFAAGVQADYIFYTGKNGCSDLENQSLKLQSITWRSMSISLIILGRF